jgi:hypothetical protein
MTPSVVILKTGSTYSELARKYGDFEHWVQNGLEFPGGSIAPNQAFRVGDCVWGVQFHPEFSEPVVRFYIAKQRDRLAEQGVDAAEITKAVVPSPAGRLLKQFGRLVQSASPSKRRG